MPEKTKAFLDALGLDEEPMGMFYTDQEPETCFAPQPAPLPSAEAERAGAMDWQAVRAAFSCVMGKIWLARKKGGAACFEAARYGCLGGSFYLGFHTPQLEWVARYVSTGFPGTPMPCERYMPSPEAVRRFFDEIPPRPAPARFCVFKPLSLFGPGEKPETVTFFARPEVLAGLSFLASFVTGDYEAVKSPFGAGCSYMVSWPLHYLAQGTPKAVLGGFDPSERKFLKTDEMTFTVPLALHELFLERWEDSFLKEHAWSEVRGKVERSRKAWRD